MKFSLTLLVVLLFSATASATEFKFLNEPLIYKDPLAYPRTPSMSITIDTSEYLKQRVGYFNGSIGKTFPLITMKAQEFKLQLGVEAGTWITLGYDAGTFPLLTQDFLIAAPLSFRYKGFSGAVKYNHISAHLGDGMDKLLKKHMSAVELEKLKEDEKNMNNGYSIRLVDPIVYSRDFVSLHGAYDFEKIGDVDIKYYVQAGYATKMIPNNLMRYFVGNGVEIKYNCAVFSPYIAEDITWYADVKDTGYSAQIGGYIGERASNPFNVRIATTIYRGADRRGQFVGKKLEEFGIGIFIQ
jgi:hypothetical protein